MEPMQDKDFDQLFKQRFDDFEAEPSNRSWENITAHLDGQKKKRRAIPSYWMAAASVVVLASAVLWLYKPVEVIKLQGKADTQVAISEKTAIDVNRDVDDVAENTIENLTAAVMPVQKERTRKVRSTNGENGKHLKQEETPAAERAKQVQPESMLANQPVKVNEIPKADVRIEESPVVLAQVDPMEEDQNTESEPARQRIRSVGGLVNFVIAQVDRRDNKIIEFKDGNEGAEVSGINLGPIKFKSRNK